MSKKRTMLNPRFSDEVVKVIQNFEDYQVTDDPVFEFTSQSHFIEYCINKSIKNKVITLRKEKKQ